jgi:hypothetical protein
VQGWVGCKDSLCPGYAQKQVSVTREKLAFSYRDLGGDMPGDERESIRVVQPDAECEVCGGPVEFVDTPRPEYPQVSGMDDLALLNLNQQGRINDIQLENLTRDKELAEMRAQMAEMSAELQRRKGGRPPKETE